MKRHLVTGFLCLTVWAHTSQGLVCPETEYDSGYKEDLPIVDSPEVIQIDSPLFPDGKIFCRVSFDFSDSNNKRLRVEEGTFEGVKYQYYLTDGSGQVQGLPSNSLGFGDYLTNWSMSCTVDEMDDTHYCMLDKGDLSVGIWKDGTPFVSIGHDHFPQSKVVVRVDKGKPISALETTGFTAAQSVEIIEQFKTGGSALTRYQEWPYEVNQDTKIDLFGFPQAWAILQKIHDTVGMDPETVF